MTRNVVLTAKKTEVGEMIRNNNRITNGVKFKHGNVQEGSFSLFRGLTKKLSVCSMIVELFISSWITRFELSFQCM